MGLFSFFTGKNKKVTTLLKEGAVIIDVRTAPEFKGGHVKGSKNIPLQQVGSKLSQLQKQNKPVVFCCASGMRSGQATGMGKSKGLNCVNGGSWSSVARAQKAI